VEPAKDWDSVRAADSAVALWAEATWSAEARWSAGVTSSAEARWSAEVKSSVEAAVLPVAGAVLSAARAGD
jgi:hypothetical protein